MTFDTRIRLFKASQKNRERVILLKVALFAFLCLFIKHVSLFPTDTADPETIQSRAEKPIKGCLNMLCCNVNKSLCKISYKNLIILFHNAYHDILQELEETLKYFML